MNITKKFIAGILIIGMFVRFPGSEAKASEAADNFVSAAVNFDYPVTDLDQANCSGFYTIFSQCSTAAHMKISDSNGDGTLDIYEVHSYDQPLLGDDDEVLPWNSDSEPPQTGFLIPVLHF